MSVPAVTQRLGPRLVEGLVATCGIIDLELGYSARDAATYRHLIEERRGLPRAPLDEAVAQEWIAPRGSL